MHSVPRLDLVHEVIVGGEDDRVRRLPRGHVFGGLLELDLRGRGAGASGQAQSPPHPAARQQRLCCPGTSLRPPLETQSDAHSEAVVCLGATPLGAGRPGLFFPVLRLWQARLHQRRPAFLVPSGRCSQCASGRSTPPFRSPCLPNSCLSSR